MTTSKKNSSKPPLSIAAPWALDVSGGAFECGDEAHGIKRGLPGLGRTPADDRLLALGFPHMVALTDAEVDCAGLAQQDRLHKAYYPWRPGVWPRELALRLLRGWNRLVDEKTRAEALTVPVTPISDGEVDELVADSAFQFGGRMPLFFLEALVGTVKVATAAVNALESFTEEDWTDSPFASNGTGFAGGFHFLLWRLPMELRKDFQARAISVLAWARQLHGFEHGRTCDALDLALHGADAFARRAFPARHPNALGSLIFLGDAPDLVRDRALAELHLLRSADRQPFDVRLGVIGGDPVMRLLAGSTARFQSTFHDSIVHQLGRVRPDLARPAMQALSSKGPAAKAAAKWLAAFQD